MPCILRPTAAISQAAFSHFANCGNQMTNPINCAALCNILRVPAIRVTHNVMRKYDERTLQEVFIYFFGYHGKDSCEHQTKELVQYDAITESQDALATTVVLHPSAANAIAVQASAASVTRKTLSTWHAKLRTMQSLKTRQQTPKAAWLVTQRKALCSSCGGDDQSTIEAAQRLSATRDPESHTRKNYEVTPREINVHSYLDVVSVST